MGDGTVRRSRRPDAGLSIGCIVCAHEVMLGGMDCQVATWGTRWW